VCHGFLNDANFWRLLSDLDHQIASEVQSQGCVCGGVLHSACYPRKPRGVTRTQLGPKYEYRLSFCCNREGCRRRCTPPSVRYLGRRVYLGVIVTLVCAIEHGLTHTRRDYLIERLAIDRRTLNRWVHWWGEQLPSTAWWIALRGQLSSPICAHALPDRLLGIINAADLSTRLSRFLCLLMPLSTTSCTHYPRVNTEPQKIRM